MKTVALCTFACAIALSTFAEAAPPPAATTNQQLLDAAISSSKASETSDPQRSYRLGPGDKISVQVFGQEKMGVKGAQLDAGGFVILPFVGAVKAGGQTAEDVSNEISTRLEKYLVDPRVSVLIDEGGKSASNSDRGGH